MNIDSIELLFEECDVHNEVIVNSNPLGMGFGCGNGCFGIICNE